MKLQAKISLTLIASMLLATVLSFSLINIFIFLFDKSYSWYDLEKVAMDASRDLGVIPNLDTQTATEKLTSWKARYPNLDFALFDDSHNLVFSTDNRPRPRPDLEELKRRMEAEEKRVQTAQFSPRFIDSIDRSPFMVIKPVISGNNFHGLLAVSVQRDFFLPFYIRVNDEKIADSYLIVFTTIAVIIGLSLLLVFLFTAPLVRRLRGLFERINGFKLGSPVSGPADPRRDEIGFIRNTFDLMAERIHQDYSERIKIYEERQELLRNISHDFRTPLTSILGYAASLEEGMYDSEEEQKKYYSIIRKKAEYMTRLFNEMMELTRLDGEANVLKRAEFNLGELAREIIIEYLPQLEAAGFVIETDIPEILAYPGDRERLSRALRNLVDNVVTHAAKGKYIKVTVRHDDAKGSPGVRLEIRDRGPGVVAQDREKIFDRFYTRSDNGPGMGLGLAIAREIVEKHGGSISVADNDGSGAVFSVFLPAKG